MEMLMVWEPYVLGYIKETSYFLLYAILRRHQDSIGEAKFSSLGSIRINIHNTVYGNILWCGN